MGGNWQLAKEKLRGWVTWCQLPKRKSVNSDFGFGLLNFVVEKNMKIKR